MPEHAVLTMSAGPTAYFPENNRLTRVDSWIRYQLGSGSNVELATSGTGNCLDRQRAAFRL